MRGGGGTGGREPGSNGGGKSTGGGRRGGGRRDVQGGGSREKWQKFRNIGTIFRNRPEKHTEAGTGSVACGRREVQTPLSPTDTDCQATDNPMT